MDQARDCEFSPDKLPKSVKVRSTCNACQQAKIRCSHDRPSCKRCQRHNIDCVYSISRRLGRPAKKKDPPLNNSSTTQPSKRIRGPKKKVKEDDSSDLGAKKGSHSEKPLFDTAAFDYSHLDSVSTENSTLQTPTFTNILSTAPFSLSDNIDMASDSWLQEFMSNPFTDPTQERSFMDPFESNDIRADDATANLSVELDNLPSHSESTSDAASERYDLPSSSSYYGAVESCLSNSNSDALSGSAQGTLQGNPVFTEHFKQEAFAWPQLPSARGVDFTAETSSLFPQVKVSKWAHDYTFTEDDLKANANGLFSISQCQSHEQAVIDLIRVNICASRTGPSVAIDSILTCQRVLQNLTETILQCRICSRARVNLLMVVIVSIDSLITTLDAITSVESDVIDRLFPEYFNPLLQDYSADTSLANQTRRYKGSSLHLRTQLDACPLIIGGFCVPTEEKFIFVKRVLHSRLSGLLGTIHRIRLCTQESLAASAARGRLVMMRETDQRLRLIIMKLNLLSRS